MDRHEAQDLGPVPSTIEKVCHSCKMPWGPRSTLFLGTLSSCPFKRGSRGLRAGADTWKLRRQHDSNKVFSHWADGQDGYLDGKSIAAGPEVPSRSGGGAHPHGWHRDPLARLLKGLASCVPSDASLAARPGGCLPWGREGEGKGRCFILTGEGGFSRPHP